MQRKSDDEKGINAIDGVSSILERVPSAAEVQHRHELVEAFVCEIPIKATGAVLSTLRSLPLQTEISLQHLRRVVKHPFLPASVVQSLRDAAYPAYASLPRERDVEYETVYVLLTSAAQLPQGSLQAFLSRLPTAPLALCTIPVPRFPPESPSHASLLTERYWPTIFTNTNPFGIHPAIAAVAERKVANSARRWMSLAWDVAREAASGRQGVGVGAVLVETQTTVEVVTTPDTPAPNAIASDAASERIAAVAGDARWAPLGDNSNASVPPSCSSTPGNPACHAVMRAIALVAQKRRALATELPISSFPRAATSHDTACITSTRPDSELSALEAVYADPNTYPLTPNGYLCLGLRAYVTHEPCVMCCMALLHSRVEGVVFEREMRGTGGLVVKSTDRPDDPTEKEHVHQEAETDSRSNIYGLHWREDLNWRFLAWRLREKDQGGDARIDLPSSMHA